MSEIWTSTISSLSGEKMLIPPIPDIPSDIRPVLPANMRRRARAFVIGEEYEIGHRYHTADDVQLSNKADRQALLDFLTDEQYATLFHFGFAEMISQFGHRLRIHYQRGNNATTFTKAGVADLGYCCYIMDARNEDANFLSNLLALTCDEETFCRKGCTLPAFEHSDDRDYLIRNSSREATMLM